MIEFRNSDQMKAFMKKESRRLNISINNVYSTFIARTILERISKYNNQKVLIKGSSAEIAYLGRLVRAITDLDIATLDSLENSAEYLTDVFKHNDDNFDLSMRKKLIQTKTGIYKLAIDAKFDKINQHISMDIQDNYSRLIEPELRIMPKIFEGDELFYLYVPSFEEYLAEKLCIIVENNKSDVLNTRVKDFYDIYQLHGGMYDPDKLTRYFAKMLKLRGKVRIDKIDTLRFDGSFARLHQEVWDKTKKKYDFLDNEIGLEGAVYYSRAVIREQLQKCGQEMSDNIEHQYRKEIRMGNN